MADGPKKKKPVKKAPPTHRKDGQRHTPKSTNPKVGEITKSTGKPKRSPTGARKPVADQTNWRTKLKASRIKFDDKQKAVFLKAFRSNNLKMRACDAAGVALGTVNEHMKNDPDFAAAYDESVQDWRDYVVDKAIVEIALEGTVRTRWKDGEKTEEWIEHPVQLLLAELKRVDHGYREKATLDVYTGGGVLLAPSDVTPHQWMEAQRIKNEERKNPMLELDKTLADAPGTLHEGVKVIRG